MKSALVLFVLVLTGCCRENRLTVAANGTVMRGETVIANPVPESTWVVEGNKAVSRGAFSFSESDK